MGKRQDREREARSSFWNMYNLNMRAASDYRTAATYVALMSAGVKVKKSARKVLLERLLGYHNCVDMHSSLNHTESLRLAEYKRVVRDVTIIYEYNVMASRLEISMGAARKENERG